MITLILPMPPRELSPNARVYWRTKHKVAQKYKDDCALICLNRLVRNNNKNNPIKPHLNIIFNPPNKRRRDLDNLLASFKYGIDAISLATGIDDSNFTITISKSETYTNNIEVTIS